MSLMIFIKSDYYKYYIVNYNKQQHHSLKVKKTGSSLVTVTDVRRISNITNDRFDKIIPQHF